MIFVTGSTGFIGSYVVTELLRRSDQRLALLVRARDLDGARLKLWKGLQLHMGAAEFWDHQGRLEYVFGDLHAPELGLDEASRQNVVHGAESVLHIAASLNRKSAKACLNTNLRGTLSVIRLARDIAAHHGLRRFSEVSTIAVAGTRSREVVREDDAIDWDRSDYDPYGRTKKFCEHMLAELLPDVPRTIFRPAIVMGDSRFPQTTQFDMIRAFVGLADLPVIPLDPSLRLDIVNADFVGEAIARLHLAEETRHETYHLSSGVASPTCREIGAAMAEAGARFRFAPRLEGPASLVFRAMNRLPRGNPLQPVGALMKVFWPYITYDTVFDNSRVTTELSLLPTPFPRYCAELYTWVKEHDFQYPHRELPAASEVAA